VISLLGEPDISSDFDHGKDDLPRSQRRPERMPGYQSPLLGRCVDDERLASRSFSCRFEASSPNARTANSRLLIVEQIPIWRRPGPRIAPRVIVGHDPFVLRFGCTVRPYGDNEKCLRYIPRPCRLHRSSRGFRSGRLSTQSYCLRLFDRNGFQRRRAAQLRNSMPRRGSVAFYGSTSRIRRLWPWSGHRSPRNQRLRCHQAA
jgi:hypothetical protein